MRRLEVMAIIIVAVIVLGTPAAVFGYQSFLRSQTPNEYTIVGRDGAWDPSSIHVKQGEKVTLRLTSDDVAHGLSIPDLNIDVQEIYPGKWVEVQFTADKPGIYAFFCTVLCSPQHGVMQGQIIVDGAAGASEAATAPDATDAGKAVYQSKCAACHGPTGQGAVGPSLIGLSTEHLATRVRSPKGAMPPFPTSAISDSDLQKLVNYIGSLGTSR